MAIHADKVIIHPYRPLPPWGWRAAIYVILFTVAVVAYVGAKIARFSTWGGPAGSTVWTLDLTALLALGLFFGFAMLYGEAHITANREEVRLTRWLRMDSDWWDWEKPIRMARADIGRVVLISVDVPRRTDVVRAPAVFFCDRKGRCVISLFPCRFRAEDVAAVLKFINVTPEGSWADFVPQRELHSRFPDAFDVDGRRAAA